MSMNKRVFVCPLLPESVIKKYRGSFAANNFCRNLISGGGFEYIYPSLPNGNIENEDLKYEYDNLKCFVSGLRKGRWSKLAFILENYKIFKDINGESSVWFYNLHYTVFVLYVLLMVFKPSVKRNVIMLDYTPDQRGVAGLINRIAIFLMNRADGMIKLANADIFKCKNTAVLPGVVPLITKTYPFNKLSDNSFLLSGALNENISMVSTLIGVFANMPEAVLHISGFAEDEDSIRAKCQPYSNIVFHGQISLDEYFDLLGSTTFLLSTRNPIMPENQCNFPSKIIEALLYNRIVVSTIHYPQLDGIKYFEIGSDIKTMSHDIKKLTCMPKSELAQYANQGERTTELFSVKVWNEVITKIERA